MAATSHLAFPSCSLDIQTVINPSSLRDSPLFSSSVAPLSLLKFFPNPQEVLRISQLRSQGLWRWVVGGGDQWWWCWSQW